MDTSSKGPRVRKEEKAQEIYTWGHPRRGDLERRRKKQKYKKHTPGMRTSSMGGFASRFYFAWSMEKILNSFEKQQKNKQISTTTTLYFRAKRGEKMIIYMRGALRKFCKNSTKKIKNQQQKNVGRKTSRSPPGGGTSSGGGKRQNGKKVTSTSRSENGERKKCRKFWLKHRGGGRGRPHPCMRRAIWLLLRIPWHAGTQGNPHKSSYRRAQPPRHLARQCGD